MEQALAALSTVAMMAFLNTMTSQKTSAMEGQATQSVICCDMLSTHNSLHASLCCVAFLACLFAEVHGARQQYHQGMGVYRPSTSGGFLRDTSCCASWHRVAPLCVRLTAAVSHARSPYVGLPLSDTSESCCRCTNILIAALDTLMAPWFFCSDRI